MALLKAVAWLSGTFTGVFTFGGFALFTAVHAGFYALPEAADLAALQATVFMGVLVFGAITGFSLLIIHDI